MSVKERCTRFRFYIVKLVFTYRYMYDVLCKYMYNNSLRILQN